MLFSVYSCVMKINLTVLILILNCLVGALALSAQRYLNPVFNSVYVETDIVYGEAVDLMGVSTSLLLDVYQPSGDTETSRPLIVYAHGGGFSDVNQTKNLPHIEAYCDSMARRGYVVASIDYRLDESINNRAVINAMHDMKAAVRYFRANAALYGINEEIIFAGGESAGAITALGVAYVDSESEVSFPPTFPMASNQTVEGDSGNPAFSSSVKATLCLCGGIAAGGTEPLFNVEAIESDQDPALLMMNGTADANIFFEDAVAIAAQAEDIGLPNLFFALPGAVHCPWFVGLPDNEAYLDTLVSSTAPFLYACVSSVIDDVQEIDVDINFSVFPNPAKGMCQLRWQSGSALQRLSGRVIRSPILDHV